MYAINQEAAKNLFLNIKFFLSKVLSFTITSVPDTYIRMEV